MSYFVILILILFNGLFAMFEMALVSCRKSRLYEKSELGNSSAKIALKMLEKPEKFLSTVQTGITLVSIISGAYGGYAFSGDLTPVLIKLGVSAVTAPALSLVIAIATITYLSLVLGELLPKTIALNNPERITLLLSPFMRFISHITYPLVVFLSFSTRMLLKILGIKSQEKPPVTEEELKILIRQGSEQGVIDQKESEIIKEVFRFGDKTAYDLMTPRMDIEFLDVNHSEEEIIEKILTTSFSRFPVCDTTVDNMLGMVSVKDILLAYTQKKQLDLRAILSRPLYFPELLPALKVLEIFREKKIHIGIVVNEFGAVEGLISLHDLSEHILGDLPALQDNEQPEIFRREDGSLLIDGSLSLDELKDLLGMPSLSELIESKNFSTLGGLTMFMLNKVPSAGDIFVMNNFRFEVMDMDGNRVDKVLVKKVI